MLKSYPPQPEEQTWQFVRELRETPVHQPLRWARARAGRGEISFAAGFRLDPNFPDPDGLLATAYADFRQFLATTGLSNPDGVPVLVERRPVTVAETHGFQVTQGRCVLWAGDTDGVRRALVLFEDELLRSGGPFLKPGNRQRVPVVRTRISRCFYSPIHRPPKNRDELADDENYYPDEYLNRLAHDGVNGLWIYTAFAELLPSTIIPEYGRDSARRLEKLRRTVVQCRRYGIRVYVFCIEPAAFRAGSPVAAAHPELAGGISGKTVFFCPSTDRGKAYLEEAARTLFTEVPHLGGIIDITVGECPTSCASQGAQTNCPRCSKRTPPAVLADVLAALERGMHAAAPEAELVSWPYGQLSVWGADLMAEGAGAMPPGVILQHDFEKGGREKQLGKPRTAGDYFLSYIGPASVFRTCARRAAQNGTRMFAKLQVGNSHEVASVPFVPVPGNLYRKYRAIHKLGLSGVMQCWYFGNYPSVMTKAAGELSFAPFPKTESAFLRSLAAREWGAQAGTVVRAWKHFQAGYRNYPLTTYFSYFGPMHDGVVWPLHLKPVDRSLAPTWLIGFPPSGDRIGECFAYSHTFEEVLTLCGRLAANWAKGVRLLESIEPALRDRPERLADISVAKALGLQFRSGLNILKFYRLRERMLAENGSGRLRLLKAMKKLVDQELIIDERLLALAQADTRLGFHSEAEGYKYFPAAIRWRMQQLRRVLARDFPKFAADIRRGRLLLPEHSGTKPVGAVYGCRRVARPLPLSGLPAGSAWDRLPEARLSYEGLRYACETEVLSGQEPAGDRTTTWQAAHDGNALLIGVRCREPDLGGLKAAGADRTQLDYMLNDLVEIQIEPQLLYPCLTFRVNCAGARFCERRGVWNPVYDWRARAWRGPDGWGVTMRIPFRVCGLAPRALRPIRINVTRYLPAKRPYTSVHTYRWIGAADLLAKRHVWHGVPAGLGWLIMARDAIK